MKARTLFPALLFASLPAVHAGTIDGITVITGDADCGIASTKTYTHAIAYDNPEFVVINDVEFTSVPLQSMPVGRYFVASDAPNRGATNDNTGVNFGDGIDLLLQHFRYGGSPQSLTLSGLVPGTTYNLRIYYRQWAPGVRENVVTFDEGAGPQSITIDQDVENQAAYVSYTYTALPGPHPGLARPVTVTFAPTENASPGATWHLYGLTNEVVTPPPAAQPDVYFGRVTADNFFAIYLGRADGSNLRYMGRDRLTDWQSVEAVPMDYRPGDYIYVAAWDAPAAFNDPAMWIGEFDIPGSPNLLVSNSTQWVAVEGPPNSNPGGLLTDPAPEPSAIAAVISSAQWAPPDAFTDNADGSVPWSANPELAQVFGGGNAEFLWHDTFDNVSSSNDNEAYVLFRSAAPVLTGVDIALDRQTFGVPIAQGATVATITGFNTEAPQDSPVFSLAAGPGDTDNAKFQVSGSQLQAGAFDFSNVAEGTVYSIRLRATGSGNASGERVFLLTIVSDADGDNLPDTWEMAFAGNLTDLTGLADGPGPGANSGDFDGDGLSDREEYELGLSQFPGLNPVKADTDDDGLPDNAEITGAPPRPATNPVIADTDGDGLPDGVESNDGTFTDASETGTDPLNPDTDEDGYPDGFEVVRGSNPLNAGSIPPPRLVGYWPFDADGATQPDHSGNNNHATPVNAAVWINDPARSGGVMDFDGNDSYLEVPDSDSLSITTAMTIAAWINPADWDAFRGILGKTAGPQNNLPAPYDLYLLQGSGIPRFYVGDGANDLGFVDGSTSFEPGEWHHLAVTIDGGEVSIYFDGFLDNTGSVPAKRVDAGTALRIGSRMDLFVDMYGQLDDVAIFEGALTDQQIQRIMSGDFSEWGVGTPPPPASDFRILSVTRSAAGSVTITFESGSPGGSFALERSADLQTWTNVPPVLVGAGATTEATDTPPAGGRWYYRVRRMAAP